MGGALVESDREIFSDYLWELYAGMRAPGTLYDNSFKLDKGQFDPWESLVPDYTPPKDGKFGSILVPTVDTVKYSWLQEQIINLKKPVLFAGESGTAKTATVKNCFNNLSDKDPDKYMFLTVNMSSRTTSMMFQNIIEENIDKRTYKSYGPKMSGKKMIVFLDDMNMPVIDKYGTQQPIDLAHFLIGRNQLYRRDGDLELRDIIDTLYVGCITPVSSGGNRVDPRVMSLFSVFNCTAPSRETIERIYNNILEKHCAEFDDDIKNSV
jgi:dynein heavy chain